jgi:ribosomal protein S8
MKNKKYWVLAAILVICANIIWATNKTDSLTSPQVTSIIIDERDTLKGLQGVYVLVENLKPEVEKYGLTRQQLQTDVELRLRQNGIRVLSKQEQFSTPGMPYLYVNVNTMPDINGLVPLGILLELKQNVFLARDTTKLCIASTWNGSTTGSVGSKKIETIRDSVKDSVDIFINDYLAANPKDKQKQ